MLSPLVSIWDSCIGDESYIKNLAGSAKVELAHRAAVTAYERTKLHCPVNVRI
jgi:hypothetical protein